MTEKGADLLAGGLGLVELLGEVVNARALGGQVGFEGSSGDVGRLEFRLILVGGAGRL